MTVIAWDGKTLAADRRGSAGGQVYATMKAMRVTVRASPAHDAPMVDVLVGFSGHADRIGAHLTWLINGGDPEKYPTWSEDNTCFFLVVHEDGRIYRFERTGWSIPVLDRHVALGSGRDYARAAMHLGRSAREAVEIACLFDDGCGEGVDEVSFG